MGRYITTTGTAANVVRTISSSYSAQVNDRIICTAGGFTITLPANTTLIDNDVIQIIDGTGVSASSNITIARNGSKIQNLNEDLVINVANACVTLVYSTAIGTWLITR